MKSVLLEEMSALTTKDTLECKEKDTIEFKKSFQIKSIPEYTKILASFANNKGGFIVFGVEDNPRKLVGVNEENFDSLPPETLSSFIRDNFEPQINSEVGIITVHNIKLGYIYATPAKNKPIICTKNSSDIFKESDIFYRNGAETRKIKYSELKAIIDEEKRERVDSLAKLIDRLLTSGSENSAVLDLAKGEIVGNKGVYVIDEKLLSKLKFINTGTFQEGGEPALKLVGEVTAIGNHNVNENVEFNITDNPNAPSVHLDDSMLKKLFPLEYFPLTKKLKERYSDFKQNDKFNEIMATYEQDRKLCWIREFNPGNKRSGIKKFYSQNIIQKLDDHYTRKDVEAA